MSSVRRGWVVVNVATVHREPRATSEVVTSVRLGETFEILPAPLAYDSVVGGAAGAAVDVAVDTGVAGQATVGSGWWRVRLDYDGYEGYMASSDGHESATATEWVFICAHSTTRSTAQAEPAQAEPIQARPAHSELTLGIVRNLWAQAYAAPVVQAPVLVTLPLGVQVRILNELPPRRAGQEPWYEVELPDDRLGRAFIQRGDVNPGGRAAEWSWQTLPQLRASLVATARRFLGVPYRWGGTTSLGIDCSGFVQLLYRLHGLFLPRDADQQAQYERLTPIDRDQLIPGDLLFFNHYGHVGLAISHYEFIHATTHGQPMVQISCVDEEHWAQARCDVRRYKIEADVASGQAESSSTGSTSKEAGTQP